MKLIHSLFSPCCSVYVFCHNTASNLKGNTCIDAKCNARATNTARKEPLSVRCWTSLKYILIYVILIFVSTYFRNQSVITMGNYLSTGVKEFKDLVDEVDEQEKEWQELPSTPSCLRQMAPDLDPRSPSNDIPRTPIQVSETFVNVANVPSKHY